MTFKQFLKKKRKSVRLLSEETGIPYSTLSDLVNGKTDIDNMRFGYVKKISHVMSLDIDELYNSLKNSLPTIEDGVIFVKNKKYHVRYKSHENETKEEALCKVSRDSERFIKDIAEWKMEDIRQEEMMEAWKNPST